MGYLDSALKTFETLAALHALPDKAALTTAEAALFLRLSPKTMERMRLDGSGPRYVQAGTVGSRGGNQKCVYLKESLLAWQQVNQVSNAMEAAVRRGKAFKTLADLVVEAPFYTVSTGRIAGTAEDTSLDAVIERLGSEDWELIWLPVVDAASVEWSAVTAHEEFLREILAVLATQKQKISVAFEATSLAAEMRRGGP